MFPSFQVLTSQGFDWPVLDDPVVDGWYRDVAHSQRSVCRPGDTTWLIVNTWNKESCLVEHKQVKKWSSWLKESRAEQNLWTRTGLKRLRGTNVLAEELLVFCRSDQFFSAGTLFYQPVTSCSPYLRNKKLVTDMWSLVRLFQLCQKASRLQWWRRVVDIRGLNNLTSTNDSSNPVSANEVKEIGRFIVRTKWGLHLIFH